jgi:hypothetical protein
MRRHPASFPKLINMRETAVIGGKITSSLNGNPTQVLINYNNTSEQYLLYHDTKTYTLLPDPVIKYTEL